MTTNTTTKGNKMKTSNIIASVSLIIVIGGIFIGVGRFIGTTNTKLVYIEDKITVVSTDVKDIKNIMINNYITSSPEIAKINEEKKDLESE